ncbi:MAG TPA: hypothetical protein VFA10_01995, partial [Ktedonobacteraceae bacterium]|nr:hypothetical protein [Ktedonobacteraceae bacterium]
MISNAWVWKRELKKELKAFNKFLAKTNVRDAAGDDYLYLKLEKFFFTTSFIIRKLFESYKLSEELASINVPVERYKRIDIEKKINLFTNYDILRYYDVDNPAKSSLGAMKLCNCFIHSFNFAPVLDEESGKLVGVHINSDHDKDKFL